MNRKFLVQLAIHALILAATVEHRLRGENLLEVWSAQARALAFLHKTIPALPTTAATRPHRLWIVAGA